MMNSAAHDMAPYSPVHGSDEEAMPHEGMGGSAPYDPHGGSMMQDQYPQGQGMTAYGHGQGDPIETHGGGGEHGDAEHGAHGDEHGGHGHGATIEKETGITPRRCTDTQCCFAWLMFTLLLLTLLSMSHWYGDVNALTHGRDYYGRICGVSAGVENMPWLYWCRDDAPASGLPAALQMTYPSCVAACPASYNSNPVACLRKAATVPSVIPGGQFGNVQTQIIKMQESLVYTAPYPTWGRGGRFCMPTDEGLRNSLLTSWEALHPAGRIMRMVNAGTLGHMTWLFFITTVLAVASGYFFLFCIKHCPKSLANLFAYPASLLTAIVCICCLLAILPLVAPSMPFSQTYMTKMNSLYSHLTLVTASSVSIALGVVLGMFSMLLFGMGYNFNGEAVGDMINAGMQCMFQVPGMYYLPAIEAFMKLLVFIFFVSGLKWFYTVGDLEKNRIHVDGAHFAGLSREWSWNRDWIICVAIWLVGFFWAMEIVNCLCQFLISKGTVAWYFTPKEKGKKNLTTSPFKDALKEAILYHWGSIVQGAFMIPFWRPIRFFYWASATFSGNSSVDFSCGLKPAAEAQIQSNDAVIKDGFTDVVIRANEFKGGSEKAHMLLEHSHKVVQHMYRDLSQTTLCVLGVFVIATLCAFVTFMITNFAEAYKEPSSSLYIANPALVVTLSWILGAYIAFGFMSAWDHTADTLLYCYVWNRKFSIASVEKFVPDSVLNIVGQDHKEEDRYPYYGKANEVMYLRSWINTGKK